MQNELTKQLAAYPFIMGELLDLPTHRLNTFDITFSLLATYSDYIVGIFEKESGGEPPELGEIDDPPYFDKSYVFPRFIATAAIGTGDHEDVASSGRTTR